MFSLPFRRSRRKSEPSAAQDATSLESNNNNSLSRINSITSTISNRSSKRNRLGRRKSHSHILSKRLSFFNNNSSDDLNSIATSNNSDYETLELTRFKSLNYDKFNKELLQYLKFHGLSAPRILDDSDFIRISMSSSGENVFLPSIVNFNEDDVENLDLNNDNGNNEASGNNSRGASGEDADGDNGVTTLQEETPRRTPHEEDIGEPVSHTFAIIISLTKPTSISTITTKLQSTTKILWPEGIPGDRSTKSQSFEMGQLSWDLNLSNYNYYIPFNAESEESAIDDEGSYSDSDSYDTGKFITENRIHPKKFQERSVDQITRGPLNSFKKDNDPFIIGNLNSSGSVYYPPGDYIFRLPVLFPPLISESLITQNSSVNYSLRTIVAQKNKLYNLGEHGFNVIRAPPSNAVSTADKPVYVNKVWNDALSYEISFPKKYVTIGANIPIKMKFAPLIKDISIRRIRVNVLEKATYCSKDLKYEYDEVSLVKNEGTRKTSVNEKVLPLLEIRTRSRTELALKEEIVRDLLRDDNLLSSCYKAEAATRDDVEIIGQLQIQSYLPFIKPNKYNKELQTKNHTLMSTIFNSDKHKAQINKNLTTKIINQGFKVDTSTYYNDFGEGVYPDSENNKFIQVSHKLQIAIRLSKKDDSGKLHHYEVMIDTPIFFLNSACVPANVELPAYNDVTPRSNSDINGDDAPQAFYGYHDQLPTFEEAISPMNSPSLIPYQGSGEETINVLSRTSTIGSGPIQSFNWNYDNIDQVVTGTSELTMDNNQTTIPRRRSAAANDIINNLKRTGTRNSSVYNSNRSTESANVIPDREDEVEEEDDIPPPPKYTESVPLLSDNASNSSSDIESLSSVDDHDDDSINQLHNESTDLTDQFTRSIYDQ